MPNPAFIGRLSVTQDFPKPLGAGGTIQAGTILYEGTILAVSMPIGTVGATTTVGTIVGGAIFKTNKLVILENIGILGVSIDTASIIGARVVSWGKQYSTLVGTNIATILPDTNTFIVQLFTVGTIAVGIQMPPKQPAAGAVLIGTIQCELIGA